MYRTTKPSSLQHVFETYLKFTCHLFDNNIYMSKIPHATNQMNELRLGSIAHEK